MSRRDDLLAAACDYVLTHSLIGLSLRPLAAAVGTSDRMLIYHFGSRDRMVSAIIEETIVRSVRVIEALPSAPTPADAVHRLWDLLQAEPMRHHEDVYLQAAATGQLGEEPYRSAARTANDVWCRAVEDWFARSGVAREDAPRVVRLVDAAFLGLHVNVTTDDASEISSAIADIAALVSRMAAVEAIGTSAGSGWAG